MELTASSVRSFLALSNPSFPSGAQIMPVWLTYKELSEAARATSMARTWNSEGQSQRSESVSVGFAMLGLKMAWGFVLCTASLLLGTSKLTKALLL